MSKDTNTLKQIPDPYTYDTGITIGRAIAIVTGTHSDIENPDIPEMHDGFVELFDVIGIAEGAFYNKPFTLSGTLKLPPTMETIGSFAFKQCNLVGQLTLPNSIVSIGSQAFSGTGFTGTLVLPLNLTVLEDGVFANCRFTSMAPPVHLISIGNHAFLNCPLYVYDFTQCNQLASISPNAFNNGSSFLDINVYVTSFTYDQINRDNFPNYVKFHTCVPAMKQLSDTVLPISDICFIEGTLIKTDQAIVPIQTLSRKHTLRGQPIQLTKTMHYDPYLVKIQAYAFTDTPTKDTYMSMNHRVYFNRVRVKAKDLVNGTTVSLVPYNGQPLYNVLVKSHTSMEVHGMTVETLDPTSSIALLYNAKLTPIQKAVIVQKMNQRTDYEDLVTHLKRSQ
jgi:hypothetical protein